MQISLAWHSRLCLALVRVRVRCSPSTFLVLRADVNSREWSIWRYTKGSRLAVRLVFAAARPQSAVVAAGMSPPLFRVTTLSTA